MTFMPLHAAPGPFFTKSADVVCGSVMPGATSGSLILTPSGTRSAGGATLLGGSPAIAAGAFTVTGPPGHPYTIQANGSGSTNLSRFPTGSMTVDYGSLRFPNGTALAPGTFSGGASATINFGLTVTVFSASLNPTGTYRGSISLLVTDNINGKSDTQSFSVTIQVDPTSLVLTGSINLAFGDIFSSDTAGSVVLTPAGGRTAFPGATLNTGSSTWHPASVTFTGAANALYTITLPTSPITLTSTSSSTDTLTVGNFTSTPSGTGILTSGSATVNVGATLNVAKSQPQGTYNGTFKVTVAYN
jgi:hypothetical protein